MLPALLALLHTLTNPLLEPSCGKVGLLAVTMGMLEMGRVHYDLKNARDA